MNKKASETNKNVILKNKSKIKKDSSTIKNHPKKQKVDEKIVLNLKNHIKMQ